MIQALNITNAFKQLINSISYLNDIDIAQICLKMFSVKKYEDGKKILLYITF